MTNFNPLLFELTCRQLEFPEIDDYELFTDSLGVKIYRKYNKKSGLYDYKIYGGLDVDPEICCQVYLDIEYRKYWDTYVSKLEEIECNSKNGLYWRIKFPWPMSNRDFTFIREMKSMEIDGKQYWVVLAKAEKFDNYPEVDGVVRVCEYEQQAVLTSDGNGGTKAYMSYYDNPGGSLPCWLINWAAKKGVPEFLNIMQKSCRDYKSYLDKKEKEN